MVEAEAVLLDAKEWVVVDLDLGTVRMVVAAAVAAEVVEEAVTGTVMGV